MTDLPIDRAKKVCWKWYGKFEYFPKICCFTLHLKQLLHSNGGKENGVSESNKCYKIKSNRSGLTIFYVNEINYNLT